MNRILHLSLYDLRTSFRDGFLKVLLAIPLLNFAFIRWAWPELVLNFPVLEAYSEVALMWACLQSAMMFGFVYGFLFLEEKEEGISEVIRVLPVSSLRLIFSRLLIGFVISSLVNLLLIQWGGLVELPVFQVVLLAMHYGLTAPLIALLLGSFAGNRIEGMAQTKIYNLLTYLPALIYFLPWKALHATALLPTYWSYRSLEMAAAKQAGGFWMYIVIGSLFYGLLIVYLSRRMDTGNSAR